MSISTNVGMRSYANTAVLARHRQASTWWPNLLMAAYGAGWSFTLPIVGQLYAAELIAAICLPFVGWRRTLHHYPTLRYIMWAYAVMLASLMISDYVNHTEVQSFIRGWANFVFAAASLIFVTSVLRRSMGSIVFLFLSMFVFKLVFGDAAYVANIGHVDLSLEVVQQDLNMFKVRFIPFLIPALMLLGLYLPRYAHFLYAVAAIGFFALDARSMALSLIIAVAIVLTKRLNIHLSLKNIVILLVPALFIGQLGFVSYVQYSLSNNPNGQTARQLQQLDDPYNPLNLLVQGRSEWTVAATVISDSPIFGYGSWAYDYNGKYVYLRAEKTGTLEQYLASAHERLHLIPTHSVLLGSWIWAGIGGFLGFILLSVAILRDVRAVMSYGSPYISLIALAVSMIIWDLIFSPLQVLRMSFPHYLALLIVAAEWTRRFAPLIAGSRPNLDTHRRHT